ncbi:MAG TPA: universal stress protein [Thermoleophilia bacterium]|jgi:nucleotide-binding universal stress UspA family protein|nr:universal stress protein [Thermoleophilia bacterium]
MGLTIVLGYDGSDCSKRALTTVAGLLRQLPDARVVVVQGYDIFMGFVPPGMTSSTLMMAGELEAQVQAVEEAGRRHVDEARAELEEAGIAVETAVSPGGAVPALLQAVEDFSADMIVIGSHGEGALSGAIMGSTAYRILHRSPVPVLVVPLREE